MEELWLLHGIIAKEMIALSESPSHGKTDGEIIEETKQILRKVKDLRDIKKEWRDGYDGGTA